MKKVQINKVTRLPLKDKDLVLEKGDLLLIHEEEDLKEIEKYESSNFDSVFYEQLMSQVKKWGQHFEYRLGIHMGFVIKDLIRAGVRYNEDDSIEPFLDGYEGSFEI